MLKIDKNKLIRVLKIVLPILLFLFIIIFMSRSCKIINKQKDIIRTQSALNDSLIYITNKKDTFWQKEVITLTPKEIIKEKIKINDSETKKFIEQLENEKKLVSALKMSLETKDSLITDLYLVLEHIIQNDTFKEYEVIDTINNFSYKANVRLFQDIVKMNLKYNYKVDLKTVVTEEDDKYIAKYYINDPNARLIGADFIYIPKPKLSKWGKAKQILIPTIVGLGSYSLGYGTAYLIYK